MRFTTLVASLIVALSLPITWRFTSVYTHTQCSNKRQVVVVVVVTNSLASLRNKYQNYAHTNAQETHAHLKKRLYFSHATLTNYDAILIELCCARQDLGLVSFSVLFIYLFMKKKKTKFVYWFSYCCWLHSIHPSCSLLLSLAHSHTFIYQRNRLQLGLYLVSHTQADTGVPRVLIQNNIMQKQKKKKKEQLLLTFRFYSLDNKKKKGKRKKKTSSH